MNLSVGLQLSPLQCCTGRQDQIELAGTSAASRLLTSKVPPRSRSPRSAGLTAYIRPRCSAAKPPLLLYSACRRQHSQAFYTYTFDPSHRDSPARTSRREMASLGLNGNSRSTNRFSHLQSLVAENVSACGQRTYWRTACSTASTGVVSSDAEADLCAALDCICRTLKSRMNWHVVRRRASDSVSTYNVDSTRGPPAPAKTKAACRSCTAGRAVATQGRVDIVGCDCLCISSHTRRRPCSPAGGSPIDEAAQHY